ncbi:hypothetical protein [Variovorax sp. RCC_210]|uniref:hypothetical protein n=1 Tax=Variovorax sp. RCC_210 TaxID=3239217 RepID=UPI0035245DF6
MSNQVTSRRQARSDDRDNSRVFAFFTIVAVVVFVGALLYFFAVDKRGEGPAHESSPPATQMQGRTNPSTPGTAPGASNAPAAPGAPAR